MDLSDIPPFVYWDDRLRFNSDQMHKDCPRCTCADQHAQCVRCAQETHFWKQLSLTRWKRDHDHCPTCTCFPALSPLLLPTEGTAYHSSAEPESSVNGNHVPQNPLEVSQPQPLDHFSSAQAKALEEWNSCPGLRGVSAAGFFKCTWCDARFSKRCDWERHEQCKYPQKGYVCLHCDAADPHIFKAKQQLETHLRAWHDGCQEGNENLESYLFTIDRGPDAKYDCERAWDDDFRTSCNASFKTWEGRQEHIKHHHHDLDNTKRKRGSGSDDADGSGGPDRGPGRPGDGRGGKDQRKRQPKRKRFSHGDAASSALEGQPLGYHDAADLPAGDAESTPGDGTSSVTPKSPTGEKGSLGSTHTLAFRTKTDPLSSPTTGTAGKTTRDDIEKAPAKQVSFSHPANAASSLELMAAAIWSPRPCSIFSGRSDCSTPRSTHTGYDGSLKLALANETSSSLGSRGFFATCRYESLELRLIKSTPVTERVKTRKRSMRNIIYEIDPHLPPHSSGGLSEVVNIRVFPDGNPMWGDLEKLLIMASRGVVSDTIGLD